MLKKSSRSFEWKNNSIPFELWTVALETQFAESAKNCVQHYFNASKSILIFMPFTNNNKTKVLPMLEKAVEIV